MGSQPLRGQEADRGEVWRPGWLAGRVGSLDTTSRGEVAEVDHYYRPATNQDEGGFWGKDLALLHLVSGTPAFIAPAT